MINDFDTTETMVRAAFDQLVGNEPPLHIDARAVIDERRRASRHRVVYRSTAVAAVVALATTVAATAARDHGAPQQKSTATTPVATPALRLTASHGKVPVVSDGHPATSALDTQIIAAIKAASPSNLTFTFGGGGTDATSVDGTADDGNGPGRLYVWAAPSPGMLTREPCSDPEFVAGASCTETHLAGDAILSVRGLVDYQGIETYEISLTRADGSGVGAEVGNFTLPPLPKRATRAELIKLTRPTVTRPSPTYNAAQIAAVVQAVDASIHS